MHILTADIHGVDDIGDVALPDGFENFVGAVVYLRPDAGPDTMLAQENRGADGGLNVKAQPVEPANQGQGFLLVLVGDGHEYSAVIFQLHPRRLHCLVQRVGQVVVVADGLAGGLHLRRQVGVQPPQLGEGESRGFGIVPLLLVGVQHVDALLLQALTQRHQRGNVCQRVARGLAQERHGTGGTGIDLDDRHTILRVDNKLNIIQSLNADGRPQLLCVLQNDALDLVGDGE